MLHFKYFGAMELVQHGQKKSAEKQTLEDSRSLDMPLRGKMPAFGTHGKAGAAERQLVPAYGRTDVVIQCAEAGVQTSKPDVQKPTYCPMPFL